MFDSLTIFSYLFVIRCTHLRPSTCSHTHKWPAHNTFDFNWIRDRNIAQPITDPNSNSIDWWRQIKKHPIKCPFLVSDSSNSKWTEIYSILFSCYFYGSFFIGNGPVSIDVKSVEGSTLKLHQVHRTDMGGYMCM